jgi:hypothetical protein
MDNRSVPNLEERLKHASEARKSMLAKFKMSLVEGPVAIEKRQAGVAIKCAGAQSVHIEEAVEERGPSSKLELTPAQRNAIYQEVHKGLSASHTEQSIFFRAHALARG